MTKALLVVDIQNDYFPGGAMELVGSMAAAEVAARVQQSFRQEGLLVFNIQHVATGAGATFFVPGTFGVEIHQSVKPLSGEPVIVKHFPNSFRETDLLQSLRNADVTELVVVGMMTHMCIDTTARAANDYGFAVTLVANACATKDLTYGSTVVSAKEVQASYLAAIDGSFAKVITA
jgi:nicotinamidase-related amidase